MYRAELRDADNDVIGELTIDTEALLLALEPQLTGLDIPADDDGPTRRVATVAVYDPSGTHMMTLRAHAAERPALRRTRDFAVLPDRRLLDLGEGRLQDVEVVTITHERRGASRWVLMMPVQTVGVVRDAHGRRGTDLEVADLDAVTLRTAPLWLHDLVQGPARSDDERFTAPDDASEPAVAALRRRLAAASTEAQYAAIVQAWPAVPQPDWPSLADGSDSDPGNRAR